MMLARVCRSGVSPAVASLLKAPVTPKPLVGRIQVSRLFASDGRSTFTRSARRSQTIMERAMAPAGEGAFTIGKGLLAGGAAAGIGALCFYGLGLSSSPGAVDNMTLWPEYVRERVRTTYMYFGASILSTAASAALCLRSPTIMNLVTRQGWVALVASIAAMVGSGMIVQSIPYKEGFGMKQLAWLAHTGIIGAVVAPMCLLGGPLIMKAAWYTAGIVGGLSIVAVSAPSEKFLYIGGPLAIGFGVVFASSIGTYFLPPTTVAGAGLYSIALYGGLLLFSAFLLHDTQKIIKNAETHPKYFAASNIHQYDPVNNSISLYLDTINIFVRILSIVAGGGNQRRK